MTKRSRKPRKQKDTQQIARSLLDTVVPDTEPKKRPPANKAEKAKDPTAVALGRKGGLIGGHARAAKLTNAQLSESARKAAQARWTKLRRNTT